jgi:hypothetical protein
MPEMLSAAPVDKGWAGNDGAEFREERIERSRLLRPCPDNNIARSL